MISILGNTRKADITFHRDGRVCISARASRVLGLTCGDVIDILEDNGEFYLCVKHRATVVGRHEGRVFCSKKNTRYYVASSIKLCRYMLELCQADKVVRLACGEPVELPHHGTALSIITKHIV